MQATRRAALTGLAACLATAAQASQPGPDWGSLELLDSEDRSLRVDQSAQPLTLLMLWASWCGACLQELDTVQAILPAIGQDKVRVILFSHPNDWVRNQQVARQRGLDLPSARLSPNTRASFVRRALLTADGTFFVPRAVLFSRARNDVVWNHVGGLDWRRPDVLDHVRAWAT